MPSHIMISINKHLQGDLFIAVRCQTLLEDLWTICSCCLYVFYYYHILSYSLGSIFYQCIYGFIPVLFYVYVWLP